jgi:hypothetical protein
VLVGSMRTSWRKCVGVEMLSNMVHGFEYGFFEEDQLWIFGDIVFPTW